VPRGPMGSRGEISREMSHKKGNKVEERRAEKGVWGKTEKNAKWARGLEKEKSTKVGPLPPRKKKRPEEARGGVAFFQKEKKIQRGESIQTSWQSPV